MKSVVITVGTSIFAEAKGIITNDLRVLEKDTSGTFEQFQEIIDGLISDSDQNIGHVICTLREKWDTIQSGLAGTEEFRGLSAELASLACFSIDHTLDKERDQLHLICSDSRSGWLAARMLQVFLENNVVRRTYLHMIEGLKAGNEKDFKEIGLRKLVDKVAELSQEQDHEVSIIATGGYKAGAVYTSLVGMLCNRPIYYLHEEFQKNIELPVLPIHLDFDLWRENSERIELILNLPGPQAESFCQVLDERIRHLLYLNHSENRYMWTPAGEVLYTAYKDTSLWSRFQAGGRSLLFHLKSDELKNRYGRYLMEIGEHIWIGDKVPEMVDHALKHHHNLFEFAEMFLVPMLQIDPDFMTPEEIYVLLCVILLHDCGHSLIILPSAPERTLLPTEIRNWHHILGYERLNPKYFKPEEEHGRTSLLSELTSIWSRKPTDQRSAQEFWDYELEAIATIGLYHRRKMPLKEGEYQDALLPTHKKTFGPLASVPVHFQGRKFTENALKIAAIFRIIDSCDLQLSRVGTEQERNLIREIMGNDIKAEENRRAGAWKLLSSALSLFHLAGMEADLSGEMGKSQKLYSSMEQSTSGDKESETILKNEIKEHRESVDAQIAGIADLNKRAIVQEAVRLCREAENRLGFKREQEAHFARAARVEKVSVAHSLWNHRHRFTISIHGSSEDAVFLEGLRGNMLEEYDAARDVLLEHGIEIDYTVRLK